MGEAKILLRSDAVVISGDAAEIERKLSVPELLWNDGFVRKTAIILLLAAAWEAYDTFLDNPLLFPAFHDTIMTMSAKVKDGPSPLPPGAPLWVRVVGEAAGTVLAPI